MDNKFSCIESIAEGSLEIPILENEDIIAFIGPENSCKSIVISELTNTPSQEKLLWHKYQSGRILSSNELPREFGTMKATSWPMWDLPKFADCTGIDQEIINAAAYVNILRHQKSVRFLLVFPNTWINNVNPIRLFNMLNDYRHICLNYTINLLVIATTTNFIENSPKVTKQLQDLLSYKISTNNKKDEIIIQNAKIVIEKIIEYSKCCEFNRNISIEERYKTIFTIKSMIGTRVSRFPLVISEDAKVIVQLFYSKIFKQIKTEIEKMCQEFVIFVRCTVSKIQFNVYRYNVHLPNTDNLEKLIKSHEKLMQVQKLSQDFSSFVEQVEKYEFKINNDLVNLVKKYIYIEKIKNIFVMTEHEDGQGEKELMDMIMIQVNLSMQIYSDSIKELEPVVIEEKRRSDDQLEQDKLNSKITILQNHFNNLTNIPLSTKDDIVVFIGPTNAGKKTLINCLLGNSMNCIQDLATEETSIISAQSDIDPVVGVNSESDIWIPRKYSNIPGTNWPIWIFPGFGDKMEIEQEIANAVGYSKVLRHQDSVRFVLVVPIDWIRNDDPMRFFKLLSDVKSLCPNAGNNLCVIVTKSYRGTASAWFPKLISTQFKNPEEDDKFIIKEAKTILTQIIQTNLCVDFRAPKMKTNLKECDFKSPDLDKILNVIKTMNRINVNDTILVKMKDFTNYVYKPTANLFLFYMRIQKKFDIDSLFTIFKERMSDEINRTCIYFENFVKQRISEIQFARNNYNIPLSFCRKLELLEESLSKIENVQKCLNDLASFIKEVKLYGFQIDYLSEIVEKYKFIILMRNMCNNINNSDEVNSILEKIKNAWLVVLNSSIEKYNQIKIVMKEEADIERKFIDKKREEDEINSKICRLRNIFDNLIDVSLSQEQDILAFIGPTKAGKSTLINACMGNPLKSIKCMVSEETYIVSEEPNSGPIMGSSGESETSIPKSYSNMPGTNWAMWDFPGFGDNKGTEQEIANAASYDRVLSNQKNVRFVLVIPIYWIKKGADSMRFYKLLHSVKLICPNVSSSLSLIVTKSDKEDILLLLKNRASAKFSNAEQGNIEIINNAQIVLENLLSNNRWASFKAPKMDSNVKECKFIPPDLEYICQVIKTMGGTNVNKFPFVLSDRAKLDLHSLYMLLHKKFNKEVEQLCQCFSRYVENKYYETSSADTESYNKLEQVLETKVKFSIVRKNSNDFSSFFDQIKVFEFDMNNLPQFFNEYCFVEKIYNMNKTKDSSDGQGDKEFFDKIKNALLSSIDTCNEYISRIRLDAMIEKSNEPYLN